MFLFSLITQSHSAPNHNYIIIIPTQDNSRNKQTNKQTNNAVEVPRRQDTLNIKCAQTPVWMYLVTSGRWLKIQQQKFSTRQVLHNVSMWVKTNFVLFKTENDCQTSLIKLLMGLETLSNLTYQTKPTVANLQNHPYQTKLSKPNQT